MSRWRRTRFVELCEAHVDCVNRTAPVVEGPTPFKMIRTTNVRDGFIDTSAVRYVTEETYRIWTRRMVPRRGDIVLTREAPLGEVGMVRNDDQIFLGQRLYHFRPSARVVDANFALYALLGPELQAQIRSFGSGSTVEHMRLPDIELLEFDCPDLNEQRQIGRLLANYDTLIENCERRIKVLDEMARALYQEWFVDYRYPGASKDQGRDRTTPPKGWTVTTAADALTINPAVDLPRSGHRSFVPMTSLSESSLVIADVEARDKTSGARFQNGDTLLARITPCLENGKTGFVQFLGQTEPGACGSTEFIVLRGRLVPAEFVYCLARSDPFRAHAIKSMSGATGRQRVQEACFDKFSLAVPPKILLERFVEMARPAFRLAQNLQERSTRLRAVRDLMLPRLLSGKLAVAEAA